MLEMRVVVLFGLICCQAVLALNVGGASKENTHHHHHQLGRRNALQQVAGTIGVGVLAEFANPLKALAGTPIESDFQTYRVIPDASSKLNPRIQSVKVRHRRVRSSDLLRVSSGFHARIFSMIHSVQY